MAVIAVLGALCALAVVVLAYVVARLSAQVRRLNGELVALASTAATSTPAASAAPPATAGPPAAAVPVDAVPRMPDGQPVDAESDPGDEDVPVITDLPDAADDLDITARRVASVTFARPLIKVASLSYGLRRALDDESRFKIRYAMRHEFRRQRKMRRRRRAGRAPSMGWRA
jgi:hypothetical protein